MTSLTPPVYYPVQPPQSLPRAIGLLGIKPYYFALEYGTNLSACYWLNLSGDNSLNPLSAATAGITYSDTIITFGQGAWPSENDHAEWGTGDGSGPGTYWKTLGAGWNDNGNYGCASGFFPKLYWE
jgi:hypothetical protein